MKLVLLFFTIFVLKPTYSQNQGINLFFASGTSTITLVTPDSIFIGADSKETLTTYNGEKKYSFNNKIHKEDNCAFAIAGLVKIFDTNNVLLENFATIMRKKIQASGDSIEYAIKVFKIEALSILNKFLTIAPKAFEKMYNSDNNKHVLQVSFAYFDGNKVNANLFDIDFILLDRTIIGFTVNETTPKMPMYIYTTGFDDEMNDTITRGYKINPQLIKDAIIYLIQIEAEAYKEDVGGTIDVIKVCNKGALWLTNNNY